jgi:ABC-type long-subunit fatty acid transport system fused permease/ATPase subunit
MFLGAMVWAIAAVLGEKAGIAALCSITSLTLFCHFRQRKNRNQEPIPLIKFYESRCK